MPHLRRFRRALYRAVWLRQTFALEAFLAALSMAWGAWVLWPWADAFTLGAWDLLAALPEWLWGAVFLGHGVAHACAVGRKSVRWSRRGALVSAALWVLLVANFLFSARSSLGVPVFGMTALAALWCYAHLEAIS